MAWLASHSDAASAPPSCALNLATSPPDTSRDYPSRAAACFDPAHHRASVCSSTGSSTYEPDSPMGQRRSSTFSDAADDDTDDGPWNLVAYHVPWGPGYEGYQEGTLPGPDGACVFLRSPTPLKRQRTTQACEKCRERKAKCSGSRPSCGRCAERGLPCVYTLSPVIPDAPLPARAAIRRLSVANSKEHLRLSTRNRMRRKSSPGEVDPAIKDMAKPMLELRTKSQPSIFNLHTSDMDELWRHRSPAEVNGGAPFRTALDASPFEPYGGQYDQGEFAHEARARAFADQMPATLYAQPISQLDSYRFPPLSAEEMNELAIPPPEQLPNVPQTKFFIDTPVVGSLHNPESQLWNDTNSFYQISRPPDISFFESHPSNYHGEPYVASEYHQASLQLMTEQPPELSYQPHFLQPNLGDN